MWIRLLLLLVTFCGTSRVYSVLISPQAQADIDHLTHCEYGYSLVCPSLYPYNNYHRDQTCVDFFPIAVSRFGNDYGLHMPVSDFYPDGDSRPCPSGWNRGGFQMIDTAPSGVNGIYTISDASIIKNDMDQPAVWRNIMQTSSCYTGDNICRIPALCSVVFSILEVDSYSYGQCAQCVYVECARLNLSPVCWNGQYSSYAVRADAEKGRIYQMPVCQSCAAGTWLTCQITSRDRGCYYTVQSNKEDVHDWVIKTRYGKEMSDILAYDNWGGLVGSCYPCSLAGGQSHYGSFLSQPSAQDVKDGILPFFCGGGNEAPTPCDYNMAATMDNNGLAIGPCLCRDGWKRNSKGTGCEECLPGFHCKLSYYWRQDCPSTNPTVSNSSSKTSDPYMCPCPIGTYSFAGASECIPCTVSTCLNAGLARVMCKGLKFQQGDAGCVFCSQCLELGCDANADKGCAPCQGVISFSG